MEHLQMHSDRWQKIAKDVAQHVPDDKGFAKLIKEAEQEAAQRKKLRLKKK